MGPLTALCIQNTIFPEKQSWTLPVWESDAVDPPRTLSKAVIYLYGLEYKCKWGLYCPSHISPSLQVFEDEMRF